MIEIEIICIAILAVTGLFCVVRIVRGPTTLDRTIASDVFVAVSVGVIGIEAAVSERTTTLPILVALSMLSYLGSVSIARFAARDDGPVDHTNDPSRRRA